MPRNDLRNVCTKIVRYPMGVKFPYASSESYGARSR